MGADILSQGITTTPFELSSLDGRAHARRTADGLGIELSCAGDDGAPTLVVRLTPARGVLELCAPTGDLRLSAPAGRVAIAARDDVVLEAGRDVHQRAGGSASTTAAETAVRARSGRASYELWCLDAKALDVRADEATWTVGRWKLRAGWVRERAENVLREVEQTLEQRAGRMRTVATGLFQVLSGRTAMRSKENTAIDGKRVLLG